MPGSLHAGGLCRTQQHEPRKRRFGCSYGSRGMWEGMWAMPSVTRSQRKLPLNSAEDGGAHAMVHPLRMARPSASARAMVWRPVLTPGRKARVRRRPLDSGEGRGPPTTTPPDLGSPTSFHVAARGKFKKSAAAMIRSGEACLLGGMSSRNPRVASHSAVSEGSFK